VIVPQKALQAPPFRSLLEGIVRALSGENASQMHAHLTHISYAPSAPLPVPPTDNRTGAVFNVSTDRGATLTALAETISALRRHRSVNVQVQTAVQTSLTPANIASVSRTCEPRNVRGIRTGVRTQGDMIAG
jgi:hypothetical protein